MRVSDFPIEAGSFASYNKVELPANPTVALALAACAKKEEAPAPAAAPPAAPTRSFLVFFDWDKYNLTDRAKQIIKEAADTSRKVQVTRIEVNGFTDTSGTPKYNMGLSIRRAQAVAAELVKNGVPRNAITAQGFGDTKPIAPNDQEETRKLNRRVEFVITKK